MSYVRTPKQTAWTKEPWTCPRCSVTMKRGGKPPHLKWCLTADEAAAHFWSKVDRTGECWLWQGAKFPFGYGHAVYRGVHSHAHRAAWTIEYGNPGGMHVLHRCDNPPCVRPKHLFLGTYADNAADKMRKGRDPRRLLKPDQVIEIRSLLGTMMQTEIAERFNVRPGIISNIKLGKAYQIIGD